MANKVDILAIGAHAGDAEISCGLALCHHVNQGKKVAMLHMTLGEKGHKEMPPERYAELKRTEAEYAAKAIGAKAYFLPYHDGELPVNDDVKFAICDIIRACKPSVILTHWIKSIHKDHINTALNVPDAQFYAGIEGFKRKDPPHWAGTLYYAENWEDREDFVPELYLEITKEDLKLWEEMVSKYALFRGEVAKFPYVDYYKSLARVRGAEVGFEYATAFMLPKNAHRKKIQSFF
ncbi:MAG: PIG-L family deacetylase [Armatimonadota bacterium]|nr:PIG-L family deacetylase [Armatimonadota bacterium]